MKTTFIIFLISFSAYSQHSKKQLANLYADHLLNQFDLELELSPQIDLRKSQTYTKLLAARSYIENGHNHSEIKNINYVEQIDINQYKKVVDEINQDASNIFSRLQKQIIKERSLGVIYPSAGRDGNVTGNTFPRKVWNLTFDDGPRSKRTQTIVDNLYERGMKGSFYMLTREAKKYPAAVDYVIDAGMEIALHSYNHKNLSKASEEVIHFEVGNALKELEELTDKKINLFRLPYGAGLRKSNLREIIAGYNLIHIFWNVDTLDWKDKDPKSILKRVKLQMEKSPRNSGVILFHDIHAQTVIASELVMDYLIQKEMKVCTTGDIIKYLNRIPQNCLK